MPGKMTELTSEAAADWAASGDVSAFNVPFNKLFEITRIQITNLVNKDIRVRGWDKFADTGETDRREPVFDYPLASQDAIVVDCADESKRVMCELVLQARSDGVGIAEATPVEVYVGGRFPF